jgi:hypothetical protein
VGKAGAYSSETPFMCSTLGQAPGLALKQLTRLERLAKSKHSSLLQKFITYGRKMFYNIGPPVACTIKILRLSYENCHE